MVLMCPYSPLEIGGEPHLNMSKVEDLRLFKIGGGKRPIQWPIYALIAILETRGEPRPSVSKVEGPVHKGRDGGRGEDDGPHVPPQPVRNRRRIPS